MKRTRRILLAAGLMFSVGALLVAPHAEALNATTKSPAIASVSGTAHYTFILGLDGAIWYTLSSSLGGTRAATGNAGNPIDASGVNFGSTGFLPSSACGGTNCSGIWFKAPGSGAFQGQPSVSLFGPIAASTSDAAFVTANAGSTARTLFPFLPSSRAMLINVVAPGLDGNIWYTLFDGTGNSASSSAMNGASFGLPATGAPSIAASNPFALAGESADSGWVATGGLGTVCSACIGVWAPYP